jgi:hypothetical protein
VTNPQKAKGDKFERDCAKFLTENTKFRVARRFGAGQEHDEGDLYGLPGMTIQAADWKDKTAALRQKPPEADQQAARISPDMLGVTAIKLRGGDIRFVFTKEAFAKLINRIHL